MPGGRGGGCPLSHPLIFFENSPIKTDASPWGYLPLKNETHLKNNPPPLPWNMKHPSTKWFLEKPQSIVTWNLAKILEMYMWRSSFLVNFQACRPIAGNFTIKWTPSQVFLESILTPPMLLPCIVLSPHKK